MYIRYGGHKSNGNDIFVTTRSPERVQWGRTPGRPGFTLSGLRVFFRGIPNGKKRAFLPFEILEKMLFQKTRKNFIQELGWRGDTKRQVGGFQLQEVFFITGDEDVRLGLNR